MPLRLLTVVVVAVLLAVPAVAQARPFPMATKVGASAGRVGAGIWLKKRVRWRNYAGLRRLVRKLEPRNVKLRVGTRTVGLRYVTVAIPEFVFGFGREIRNHFAGKRGTLSFRNATGRYLIPVRVR